MLSVDCKDLLIEYVGDDKKEKVENESLAYNIVKIKNIQKMYEDIYDFVYEYEG